MEITAKVVNELRQQTGAGLMDCKKALQETGGDMEAAIDFLRKKGQKISASRADRDAKEGVVIAVTNPDNSTGIIVNLSCETDFVAKNEDFVGFAQAIADHAIANDFDSKEALLASDMGGRSVEEQITEQMGKIGEKIEVNKYERVTGAGIVPYIHAGYKIGVLVELNQAVDNGKEAIGKDVAMQIAAMSPIAVDKEDVDQSTIDREMAIFKDQIIQEGKPENMAEQIAKGKLNKFFKENTLLNQPFVKDGQKTVSQVLKEVDNDLTVVKFKRVALGS